VHFASSLALLISIIREVEAWGEGYAAELG